MTNRTILLIALFSLLTVDLCGQSKLSLSGEIFDCKDSLSLTYAKVSLYSNNSIVDTAFVEPPFEKFVFKNLSAGDYQILVEYFYYPKSTQSLSLKKDSTISICLQADNIDSLLAAYTLLPMYNICYFGRPSSASDSLNLAAKKYGVQYFSIGCVPFGDFHKYNEVVNKILDYRNGKDWEKFKAENNK